MFEFRFDVDTSVTILEPGKGYWLRVSILLQSRSQALPWFFSLPVLADGACGSQASSFSLSSIVLTNGAEIWWCRDIGSILRRDV